MLQEYKSFIPLFMRIIIFIKIVLKQTIIFILKTYTLLLYTFGKIIHYDDR